MFTKVNRFTGEYYRWDTLESLSSKCSHYFMNGKFMLSEEKEKFQVMLKNNVSEALSCGGQVMYKISP